MGPVVKHRHGGIDWDDDPCPICEAQTEVVLESRRTLAAQQRYEAAQRRIAELEQQLAEAREALERISEFDCELWATGGFAQHCGECESCIACEALVGGDNP